MGFEYPLDSHWKKKLEPGSSMISRIGNPEDLTVEIASIGCG